MVPARPLALEPSRIFVKWRRTEPLLRTVVKANCSTPFSIWQNDDFFAITPATGNLFSGQSLTFTVTLRPENMAAELSLQRCFSDPHPGRSRCRSRYTPIATANWLMSWLTKTTSIPAGASPRRSPLPSMFRLQPPAQRHLLRAYQISPAQPTLGSSLQSASTTSPWRQNEIQLRFLADSFQQRHGFSVLPGAGTAGRKQPDHF